MGFIVEAQGLTPERYRFSSSIVIGEKAECKTTDMVDLGGIRIRAGFFVFSPPPL